MKITNVKTLEIIQTPHNVDVRKVYEQESAQAMHITL